MYKCVIRFISIFLFFLLISCSVSRINETASERSSASSAPGDCSSCHKDKKVLPEDHVDTMDMKGDDCSSCHDSSSDMKTNIPLSHKHTLNGVSCKGCHEDISSPGEVNSKVCKSCHDDTAELLKATSDLVINPHFSPHEGEIPDCNECHHQHRSSENYCNGCHGQT